MKSARILLRVTAGLVPGGSPIEDYTRNWAISTEEWEAARECDLYDAAMIPVMRAYGEAQEYARTLMNPRAVNWVRLEWIYL